VRRPLTHGPKSSCPILAALPSCPLPPPAKPPPIPRSAPSPITGIFKVSAGCERAPRDSPNVGLVSLAAAILALAQLRSSCEIGGLLISGISTPSPPPTSPTILSSSFSDSRFGWPREISESMASMPRPSRGSRAKRPMRIRGLFWARVRPIALYRPRQLHVSSTYHRPL
jgi:hypothetical protein